MNNTLDILKNYFSPFESIDQMMIAIHVYSKLKHYELENFERICQTINCLTKTSLKTEEIKLFTNKINFHKQLYPVGFIESLNILNEKIDDLIYKNDWAANEFITDLTKCINCKNELNRKTCTTYKEAVVYFISKIPQKCFNLCKTCSVCKTQH